MKYIQLIEQARATGVATEKKMNAAIEQMSCDLASIKNEHPDIYWRIMRHQHAVIYDRHYSEKFAHHDVNNLEYGELDDEGMPTQYGPHWTSAQIESATKGLEFHPKVNIWDKYVAFNSMYADLCTDMSEEEIIKAAYLFYFRDAYWQYDDCTKIWDYITMHATM